MWEIFRNSRIINLALFGLLIFVGYHTFILGRQAFGLYHETRTTKEKIAELSQKKEELETYLRELEHRQAIEREAKERFNLKKPGEEVVVVIGEDLEKNEIPPTPTFFGRVKLFLASIFSF